MAQLDNYATPDNLLARISIHNYAVNPNWTQWLFTHELPADQGAMRILDVGCGTAVLWAENIDRIEAEWSITLADSSEAMLDAARQKLNDRTNFVLADVQQLPFPDVSFDVVIANHMLYHVPDRPRAFSEISRVLKPGGWQHCSTNGHGHMAELAALLPDCVNTAHFCEEFGLETGLPQLEAFFTDISVQRFDNELRVPSPEPVLAYVRSSENYSQEADLSAAEQVVAAKIKRDGAFSISTFPGVISARKPLHPASATM